MTVNRRKVLFTILGILIFCALMEGLAFFLGFYLKNKGWVYAPHITESYSTYLARVNPRTGWPSQASRDPHNQSGSRVIQAFPDLEKEKSCISLYGAMAWCSEVDAAHSWGNVLSTLLNGRVVNYGVAGYGTDQAYLRFHYNKYDNSPITIIVYSSDDIRRNVNQLRNLIVPTPQCAIKPRFVLDNHDQLKEVPIPQLTESDYQNLINRPDTLLRHDFFIPGGPANIPTFKFPYSINMLRLAKPLFLRGVLGTPKYAEFYQPAHPSRALKVTTEIIQSFYLEAQERDKSPLVVILPQRLDIIHYNKNHKWIYQALLDNLHKRGIKYLNVGPAILGYLGERNPNEIFSNYGARNYNEEGYRLLAQIVYDYLLVQNPAGVTHSGPAS